MASRHALFREVPSRSPGTWGSLRDLVRSPCSRRRNNDTHVLQRARAPVHGPRTRSSPPPLPGIRSSIRVNLRRRLRQRAVRRTPQVHSARIASSPSLKSGGLRCVGLWLGAVARSPQSASRSRTRRSVEEKKPRATRRTPSCHPRQNDPRGSRPSSPRASPPRCTGRLRSWVPDLLVGHGARPRTTGRLRTGVWRGRRLATVT